jgi:uncharacterized protein involved in outer membrane biogenesis
LLALLLLPVVVLGCLLVFITLLDPNQYKPELIEAVRLQTGRQLTLGGPVEIAWWPQIRVRASTLTVGNAAGFAPADMLEIKELEFAVDTLPLLSGRITMDTARVHGLKARLARNAEGRTNWDDLVAQRASAPFSRWSGLGVVALGGVDVDHASIEWDDARTGQSLKLSEFKVHTGPLAFDQPVAFTLASALESAVPALTGDVTGGGQLTYHPQSERYVLEGMSATATLQGKALPGGKANLSLATALELNLSDSTAHLKALKAEGLGLKLDADIALDHLTTSRPGGRAQLNLQTKDLGVLFRVFELPGTPRLLAMKNRALEIHGVLWSDADADSIKLSDFAAKLPEANLSGEFALAHPGSAAPTLRAQVNATAGDLQALLLMANDWRGGDASTGQSLGRLIGSSSARGLKFTLDLDADIAGGRVALPILHLAILDSTLDAVLTPTGGSPGRPAFKGELKGQSPDLPALLALFETLRGASGERLDQLGRLATDAPSAGTFRTAIDADLALDRIDLQALESSALGNLLHGQLSLHGLAARAPELHGKLNLEGPDLPRLFAQIQSLRGERVPESTLAADTDKRFALAGEFSASPGKADLQLINWHAEGMGVQLKADFHGQSLQRKDGVLEGKLSLEGKAPGPFLQALNLQPLAEGLKHFVLESPLSGAPGAIVIGPVTASASWLGPQSKNPAVLSFGTGAVEIYPARERATAKELALHAPGLEISGSLEARDWATAAAWSGQVSVPTTDLRAVAAALGLSLPTMADVTALRGFSVNGIYEGNARGVRFSHLNAKLDETTLKGSLGVEDFAGPALAFSLSADTLNLARYLAPPAAPAVSSKRKARGPVVAPELALLAAAKLPVETLRQLKVTGDAKLDLLLMGGLKLERVEVALNGSEGLLRLDPVNAEGYQGRYSGVATLDARGAVPQLSLNANLAKVSLEPLLMDLNGRRELAGSMNFEARLSAAGATSTALRESVAGQATFAVQNGVLRGLDAPSLLRGAEQLITGKTKTLPTLGGKTPFKALTGTLEIRDGAVFNRDLRLDGAGFRLTGEGMLYDLKSQRLKYGARLALDPDTAEDTGFTLKPLGNIALPLRCEGPLAVSSCAPDLKALLKQMPNKTLRKVEGAVEKLLDGKAGRDLKKLLKQ